MEKFLESMRNKVWMAGDPEKDRRVGLIVFGTLEILLGILCFSIAMLLLVIVSSAGLHGMKPVHYAMTMGGLFYLTGWFVVMGMGSFQARRWARELTLVGAWVSVFLGTLLLSLLLHVLPEVYVAVADSGLFSPETALAVLYFSVLVLVVLGVLFPLAVSLFYGRKSVKETCERLNPAACWTDRCPLPLLAMSFISLLGSLSIVFGATSNYTVFFFGRVFSGAPGFVVVALISVAFGYVGWGAYTRKMHAWWAAYALVLLISASMMLTFSELDMPELYAHMGYSAAQVVQLESFRMLNPSMLTFMSCTWGVMACIFLVWVRDCFRAEKDEVVVKSYQQIKAEEEAARPERPPRPRMRID